MKDLTWNYGITTVPQRKKELLPRTIESLKIAGFDQPHLFVDGCDASVEFLSLNLPITTHSTQIRTTGNWIVSLWELWASNPHADRYALFQDDLIVCKGLRQYLNQCKWPTEKAYLNLLTFRENHELIHSNSVGWHPSDQLGKGAVGLVFDSVGIKSILSSPHLVNWIKSKDRGHRLIDRAVSQSLKKLGFTEFIHNPSLIQHTGKVSSMGSDRHPMSSCFLGENYDALNFLNKSKCKIIESGINRPTIRVAIPAVDSFDLTSACLEALSKTSWPLIIDYIDNGSKLGTLEKVKEFGESLGLKMNCTRFDTNKGFTEAVNVSIQLAINNNQHCLILNNDCIVAHDTIRKLHAAMLADNLTAAVGPVSMDKGAQSLRRKNVRRESGLVKIPPDPTATEKISKSLKRFRTRRVKTLAFFCTLIRNEALKQVGLLPQSFKDGLGADDAWCHLAIKKGFTVNVAHNAYAHHIHSETFRRLNINRQKAQVKASRKLKQVKKRGREFPTP